MNRFGDPGYLLGCGITAVLAILYRVAERLPRLWRNRHYRTSHRKLRAAGHGRDRAHTRGAAARTSSEQPPPAPGTGGSIPGAGPKHRATDGDTPRAQPGVPTPSSPVAQTVTPPSGGLGPHTPVGVTTQPCDVHRAPAASAAR